MPLKFDEISKIDLKLLTSVKKKLRFCHISVAFLEDMNFIADGLHPIDLYKNSNFYKLLVSHKSFLTT